MKCQRHILEIRSHDRIRNTEITERTGLPPLMDQFIRRRSSLFGHVTRLGNDTPAHQALRHQTDISLGRLPDRTWKRPPGIAQEASGWIRFALITTYHRLIYGDLLSVEVIPG